MAGQQVSDVPPWVKGAVWAIGIGLPLLVGVLTTVTIVYADMTEQRFEQVSDELTNISALMHTLLRAASENATRIEQHDKSALDWRGRIIANEQSIQALRNDASARKDPFTGTEGKELSRQIVELYRKVDMLHINQQNIIKHVESEHGRRPGPYLHDDDAPTGGK